MEVIKLGGSLLKNADNIKEYLELIMSSKGQKLVVCSALYGVTNILEQICENAASGNSSKAQELSQKVARIHTELAAQFNIPKGTLDAYIIRLQEKVTGMTSLNEAAPKIRDQVLALGEQMATNLLYEILKKGDGSCAILHANDVIKTDSSFGRARVDFAQSSTKINNNIPSDMLIITQGHIGSDANNNITTLGRESSDYSALIYAAALGQSTVTIFKDVPGIANSDPEKNKEAKYFKNISFSQISSLAKIGAKVLHPKSIALATEFKINVLVKNIEDHGTLIGEKPSINEFNIINVEEHIDLIRISSNGSQSIQKTLEAILAKASETNSIVHSIESFHQEVLLLRDKHSHVTADFYSFLKEHYSLIEEKELILHRAYCVNTLNINLNQYITKDTLKFIKVSPEQFTVLCKTNISQELTKEISK